MFPVVGVVCRLPSHSDLEVSHGKVLGTIIPCYQPSNLNLLEPWLFHVFSICFGEVNRLKSQGNHLSIGSLKRL